MNFSLTAFIHNFILYIIVIITSRFGDVPVISLLLLWRQTGHDSLLF